MKLTTTPLRCCFILAAVLLGPAGGPIAASAQPAPPDDLLPYRKIYDISRLVFDQCGDVARGDLYRKVVRQKVIACPVPAAEKDTFLAWANARSAAFAQQNAKALASGPLPATPEEQRRCKALTAEPTMADVNRRLDRFGHGQGGADDVIHEACRPAAP